MIAIYRGEDTCFAGAEPIPVKIDTELDLTGFTAKLYFGSIVKEYGTEEVATKQLALSFTAEETSSFFPGQGFAIVKVFDPEGRVAILKKFVIDVRFREWHPKFVTPFELSKAMEAFNKIRSTAKGMHNLTEDDDTATVKQSINTLLDSMREKVIEYTPVFNAYPPTIPPGQIKNFADCIVKLEQLSNSIENLSPDESPSEIKRVYNSVLDTIKE